MSSAARSAALGAALLLGWACSVPLRAQATPSATAPNGPSDPALAPTAVEGDFLALQRRYTALLEQARPAVVKINAARPEPEADSRPTVYACTGFFVSRDGYVLTTNAHLLNGAERVWLEHQGVPYAAEVVGLDLISNVALLRALRLPKEFGVLNLTDSPGLPPPGALLLAVTCKLGEDAGPSPGMVQGYNTNYGERPLPTLHLRTNIPYDGGEGGSPVFDLEGRLVGILVVSLTDTRSSLVLPTRAALRVREDLLNQGRARYGRFGFQINQIVDANSGPRVVVTTIEYGGSAAAAGLRIGDVLLSIGGTSVRSDQDLRQVAFFARPGQYLAVKVRRADEEVEMPLQVGEMAAPAEAGSSAPPSVAPAPLGGTPPPPPAPTDAPAVTPPPDFVPMRVPAAAR